MNLGNFPKVSQTVLGWLLICGQMVGQEIVISLHQNVNSVLSLAPFQLPPVQARAALWKRGMLKGREPKGIEA